MPKDHKANGEMIMNFSANMLGLDNAATPFGLKAMKSLQELNPSPDTASNAQIMFMVLHSAGGFDTYFYHGSAGHLSCG